MAESNDTTVSDSTAKSDGAATKSDSAVNSESAAKSEGATPPAGESGAAKTPSDPAAGYSRGENQKPISRAYKNNWDNIFGKKKRRGR